MTSVTLKFSKCVALAGLLTVTYSCSKDTTSASTGSSSLRNAVAAVGVTSPTTHSSTSTASLFTPRGIWDFLKSKNFFISTKAYAVLPSTLLSFADFQTAYTARLASSTVTLALADFSLSSVNAPVVNCYGPSITGVTNHPDAGASAAIPSGDLGIWVSTEGANNEACSAAKVNAITQQLQGISLQGLILMAGVNVAARLQRGDSSLSIGSSVNVTTSIAPEITAFTVTAATLERLANDVDNGRPVYKTTITGTDSSSNPISFILKHSPVSDADNSTYKGIFYGYMPQSGGINNNAVGFSLIYSKSSATDITFFLKTGETANNVKNGSTLITAADGSFNFSAAANNGYRILTQIDPITNLGTMNVAWQAGSGDSNTRVFLATTSTSGTSITGFSYVGYGDPISTTDGSITKMICNWVVPGGNHTGIAKAQAQEMIFDAATNVFKVVPSTGDHITYANTTSPGTPANECNLTAGQAATYTMTWWQGETTNTAAHTNPAGAVAITNNLVNINTTVALGGVGIIPTITAPTVSF